MENLIIIAVGQRSLHERWISGVNADVCLICYDDSHNRYVNTSKYFFKERGLKWFLVHNAVNKIESISDYKYIWIPDDDILTDANQVNSFFDYIKKHNIHLAQPSLKHGSHFSHQITLSHKISGHRNTNFVEAMMPCFKQELFSKVSKYFLESGPSNGWGLDFIYSTIALREGYGLAIIDEIAMLHTQPVGANWDIYNERCNILLNNNKFNRYEPTIIN